MEKAFTVQLIEKLGKNRANFCIREIEELHAHTAAMRALIASELPNARILLIDNVDPVATQYNAEQLQGAVAPELLEVLADAEGTTPERLSTAQRYAAMFGYSLDDSRLIVWNAPTETPVIALDEIDGILFTGSPAMITDAEDTIWMQRVIAVVQQAYEMDIPMLGICFGHQVMAKALGGGVDWITDSAGNRIKESGPAFAWYTEEGASDPLFAGLAEEYGGKTGFCVQASHSQHITHVPDGAVILAANEISPVQALRYTNKRSWSIQNHPENSALLHDMRHDAAAADLSAVLADLPPETHALLGYTSADELRQRIQTIPTERARTVIFANFLRIVADYRKSRAASIQAGAQTPSEAEVRTV